MNQDTIIEEQALKASTSSRGRGKGIERSGRGRGRGNQNNNNSGRGDQNNNGGRGRGRIFIMNDILLQCLFWYFGTIFILDNLYCDR